MDWITNVFNGFVSMVGSLVNVPLLITAAILLIAAAILNPKGPTNAEQLVFSILLGTIGVYIGLQAFHVGQLDALLLGFIVLGIGLIWIAVASRKWVWRIVAIVAAFATIGTFYGISVTAAPTSPVAQGIQTVATSVTTFVNSYQNH